MVGAGEWIWPMGKNERKKRFKINKCMKKRKGRRKWQNYITNGEPDLKIAYFFLF